MIVQMRNKTTGEFRDVEADGPEFQTLSAEVNASGQSAWEQSSYAHAAAVAERAKYGELDEADLGDEHQAQLTHAAILLDAEGVAPEVNPHLALTPGEIENGMTPESKLADLKQMYAESAGGRQAILDDAAAVHTDETAERQPSQQAKGLRARAGGSDDRDPPPENAAAPEAPAPKPEPVATGSGSSSGGASS